MTVMLLLLFLLFLTYLLICAKIERNYTFKTVNVFFFLEKSNFGKNAITFHLLFYDVSKISCSCNLFFFVVVISRSMQLYYALLNKHRYSLWNTLIANDFPSYVAWWLMNILLKTLHTYALLGGFYGIISWHRCSGSSSVACFSLPTQNKSYLFTLSCRSADSCSASSSAGV